METVSPAELGGNVDNILARVIASSEPLLISGEGAKSVVMLSLAEFQSLQETLYLLSNPANAAHLKKSLTDLTNNQGVEIELADL